MCIDIHVSYIAIVEYIWYKFNLRVQCPSEDTYQFDFLSTAGYRCNLHVVGKLVLVTYFFVGVDWDEIQCFLDIWDRFG